MIGLWRGNAGNSLPAPTAEQVIQFYSATSALIDESPVDSGDGISRTSE